MYKDDYISAVGKLTPRQEWMKETLAKMRAVEAAPDAGTPPLRVVAKRHTRLRRLALPIAAAVAVLVVPAVYFWGVAMHPAGGAAAAQYSLQSGGTQEDATGGELPPGEQRTVENGTPAADDDAAQSAAAAAPEQTDTLPEQSREKLVFAPEDGGMGSATMNVRTDDDLASANPTRDLPADALPTELPVYVPTDSEDQMRAALEDAAATLGGTLEDFDYDTSGPPDAAYYRPYASGKSQGVSFSMIGQKVHFYRYAQGDGLMSAQAGLSGEALYRYYYDQFGAAFLPLEHPAFEITGTYNIYKQYHPLTSVFYEAGSASDSLAQKLYNYTFRSIQISVPEGDVLVAVNYLVEPELLGTYALRTLDEAEATLRAQLGEVQILHWEIVYYQSNRMDTIQPAYRFLIEAADGEEPYFDDGDPTGYRSVQYVTVPALRPELLEDLTFAPSDG